MQEKIFVSNLGIVSGIGIGVDDTLKSLLDNKTAIDKVQILSTKHKDLPISEVKYTNEELIKLLGLNPKDIHTRTSLLGRLALRETLKNANLSSKTTKDLRVAFIFGTTVAGMDRSEKYYLDFINPSDNSKDNYIEAHSCGKTAELIAEEYDGSFDFISTISTACSSALNSIILGANLIKSNRADIAIVGGSESISKFHFNGFNTLMILDKNQCSPFDKNRAGLNLGEGAAFMILESEKAVNLRKTEPLCELLGYANTCDAFHQTATSPDAVGATLCMKKAISNSDLLPKDIDYINAHGTGTNNNDDTEATAVENIFGTNPPHISSVKSFIGHTTSAAGSVEAVISIIAMLNNFIPANINFFEKMENHNIIPNNKNIFKEKFDIFITNSFGFGGNDSSCVFKKIKK